MESDIEGHLYAPQELYQTFNFSEAEDDESVVFRILMDGNNGSSSNSSADVADKHVVTTSIGFLPLGLGLTLVSLLGLVGNFLCALILRRPKMKSTYSLLTLALTFCDTIYLLTKLFRYGFQSMFLYFSVAKRYTDIFYPIVGPQLRAITFSAHTGSTYFTIAVALDRYLSVCWPYEARTFCTRSKAITATLLLVLFSVVYNLPRWWEFYTEVNYSIPTGTHNDSYVTYYKMTQSPFRNNKNYKKFYIFWAYFFIMFFIPFVSLSTFNFLIWRAIQLSSKRKVKLTSRQKQDNSFAIMLLSIVVVFLFCSLDYLILDLISFAGYKYDSFYDNLGNMLLTLNSAVNFILYCVFGRRFREEFLAFCYEITGRKIPPRSKSENTNSPSGTPKPTKTLDSELSSQNIGTSVL